MKRARELRFKCDTCGAKQWQLCKVGGWIVGFFHDSRKEKVAVRIKVKARHKDEAEEFALDQVIDPNAEVDDIEELGQ